MEQSGYEFEKERKAKKENEIKSKFYIVTKNLIIKPLKFCY